MKKSQLRKIIRESIKQLLTEQTGPGPNCVTNINTPPMQQWSMHCSIFCDGGFAQMCCQNTNNQPYTAPSSNGWATLIGIGGQTVPCATSCTPTTYPAGYWHIPADDIVAIAIQYGSVNTNTFGGVINPSSTYPTMFPSGHWFGIWDSTQADNYACNSFMGSPPSSCDTTPASACATQWFGNTAGNFTAWMASKDCSNYQSTSNNLEQQAYTIMQGASNPQQGPYNNWNDIKNAANASGLQQPQKGQFKRKAAKGRYALCMNQECNC